MVLFLSTNSLANLQGRAYVLNA